MRAQTVSFDWAKMLEQLLAAGHKSSEFYGSSLTAKMIYYYRNGSQPLHWRGERIVSFWCQAFEKKREEAPMRDVVRGHRADRKGDDGPKVVALPNWPAPQPTAKPIKRRKALA